MNTRSHKTRMKPCWILLTLWLWIIFPQLSQAVSPQEEIETLDIVEITGTAEPEQKRNIPFPLPQIPPSHQWSFRPDLRPIDFLEWRPAPNEPRLLLDQTAQTKGMATPVKPLKTDHPPYPRQAREKGWEGVVLLHLNISNQGNVVGATVKESSGHAMLDTQALQTIQHWKFHPAQNGNFPVPSIVNLPIKFDLRQ
ncbi:MAG: energy transducer TonB [Nitrospirales bacterium]|nr:energy transducer TonB [Nitrospirales bacterium]